MTATIHHMGLSVSDLDRSVEFYASLGLREIARDRMSGERLSAQTELPETEIDVSLLVGSNTFLELLCYRNPVGRPHELNASDAGSAHACIVVDDLDALYADMRDRGIHFHAAPTKLFGDTKMVYVRDPDGVIVELLEPADDLTLETLLSRTGAPDRI